MIRWSKTLLILMLAVFLIAASYVGAQEKAQEKGKEPPYSKPYPMGQVTIKLKQMAAGVGLEWGSGVLTYEGKQYTFKVKGINLGGVGITSVTAQGNVYNLFSLGEFPGRYMATGAAVALFKGAEGEAFRNSKGVHITLKAVEKGVNLKIGPDGFTIKMEEAL